MKHVIFLDADERNIKTVREILENLEGDVYLHNFSSVEAFSQFKFQYKPQPTQGKQYAKLEGAKKESSQNLSPVLQVDILIIGFDLISEDSENLIKKIQSHIKDSPAEDSEAELFLMGYDKNIISIKELIHLGVDDIVYTPIDHPILAQKLTIALKDKQSAQEKHLYSLEVSENIFMAYECPIVEIGYFGFSIESDKAMDEKGFYKVFHPHLTSEGQPGVWTRCLQSEEEEDDNTHLSFFSFFAVKERDTDHLRKWLKSDYDFELLPNKKQTGPMSQNEKEAAFSYSEGFGEEAEKTHIIVIDTDKNNEFALKDAVSNEFDDVEMHHYPSLVDFFTQVFGSDDGENPVPRSSLPFSTIDMIFIDVTYIESNPEGLTKKIYEKIQGNDLLNDYGDLPIFAFFPEQQSLSIKNFMISSIDDFIYKPFHPLVLREKVKIHKKVDPSEKDPHPKVVSISDTVDVAQEYLLEEISEFGMRILSPTPIDQGQFSKFYSSLFITENEGAILARCYQVQPHPTVDGQYQCWFVFFGVTDLFLKNIRKWLREKYIEQQ